VKKALDGGADLHFEDPEDDWAALHLAAKYGDAAMISVLLKAGADLEGRQKNALGGDGADTPLHMASYHGHLEAIEALLALKAKRDVLSLGR